MKSKWFMALSMVLLASTMVLAADEDVLVKDLVDRAVQAFQDKGKDYSLKLLSATAGPFRKGEYFVFAVSFDGVVVAHAATRDLVGKNLTDTKDAKGKPFVHDMVNLAKEQDSGWIEYYWTRVGEKEPVIKRSYVKRVPGEDILVGAGYYLK
jgi:cytochrome c